MLDNDSCFNLGQQLKKHNIEVIPSRLLNKQQILHLFESGDIHNNGFWNFSDFNTIATTLNKSLEKSDTDLHKIFHRLAIRRLKKRDRIYFYDLYNNLRSYDSRLNSYDITKLQTPIHFLFDSLVSMLPQTPIYKKKTIIFEP